jgi:hypothetical protein
LVGENEKPLTALLLHTPPSQMLALASFSLLRLLAVFPVERLLIFIFTVVLIYQISSALNSPAGM